MKKIQLISLICLLFVTSQLYAQDSISVSSHLDKTSFGLGMGLDFGGFGGNLLVYPSKNLGFFLGGGYAMAGLGVNGGVKLRIPSKKPNSKTTPYFLAMYGYNAAIAVKNATQFNKLFYGTTFGFGIDYRSSPLKNGYWSFALLLPIRGTEVQDYMDDLKDNHRVEFKNGLTPVTISIGYRFILN